MTVRSALKSPPGTARLWRLLRTVPGARILRETLFGNWQDDYWKSRKHLRYYNEVLRVATSGLAMPKPSSM